MEQNLVLRNKFILFVYRYYSGMEFGFINRDWNDGSPIGATSS